MSIPVTLEELAGTVAGYGMAYLLTVDDGGAVRALAVAPTLEGSVFTVPGGGRRTRANLVARPAATLLWPPPEPDGYSLIVDGVADCRGAEVVVQASTAVLHRSPRTVATSD